MLCFSLVEKFFCPLLIAERWVWYNVWRQRQRRQREFTMHENEEISISEERQETVADGIAFVHRCLDLLDKELTRISKREKPTMTAEMLLCPVLNAKTALGRIEAAWKREECGLLANIAELRQREGVGDSAAMREALMKMRDLNFEHEEDCFEFDRLINAALSAPARNCDVGTAEEQEKRYHATGEVYHTFTLTNALHWAQMPYEEEK